jgi:hypothetical protein
MTKTQLFYIDFQWLAVGRVRCGFVHKGSTVICHVFDHTNELAVPYMSNPNLPIRCEIQNTTTEVGSMKQICATVGSEGGYIEAGTAWELSSPTLRAVSSGSTLPVMAIRLKNSYNNLQNRAFVRIGQISAFTEDQTVRYNLVKIPNSASLSGGSWVSMDPDSVVEYNVGATSYTTGSSFLGGFIFAGGTGAGNNIAGQQQTPAPNARGNFIAQNFQSNDSEIYALVIKNMTGTSTDVGCSITWQEIY